MGGNPVHAHEYWAKRKEQGVAQTKVPFRRIPVTKDQGADKSK
jgi:hypothetical protein